MIHRVLGSEINIIPHFLDVFSGFVQTFLYLKAYVKKLLSCLPIYETPLLKGKLENIPDEFQKIETTKQHW